VKKIALLTVAVVLFGLASVAQAQQRTDVVLVDVNHILKNCTALTEMQADLKTAVAVAENEVKARAENKKQMLEQLKQLQKGTPQYQQLEDAITKETTEINLRLTQGRRKFAQQEAQNFHAVYRSILAEVAAYCRQHGVRLAIKHDGKPLSEEDFANVFQSIQHHVLYADPGIDITQLILEQLNRRHAARNAGPRR
jgi:Skp family chaperone for outer membrane proteins